MTRMSASGAPSRIASTPPTFGGSRWWICSARAASAGSRSAIFAIMREAALLGEARALGEDQHALVGAHALGEPAHVLALDLGAGAAAHEVVRQPLAADVEARVVQQLALEQVAQADLVRPRDEDRRQQVVEDARVADEHDHRARARPRSSPSTCTERPSSRRVAAKIDPAHACWTCQVLDSSHSPAARAQRQQPGEPEDGDRDRLADEVDPEDAEHADRHERDAAGGEPHDVDEQRQQDERRQQRGDDERAEHHRRDRAQPAADHLAAGLVDASAFHRQPSSWLKAQRTSSIERPLATHASSFMRAACGERKPAGIRPVSRRSISEPA